MVIPEGHAALVVVVLREIADSLFDVTMETILVGLLAVAVIGLHLFRLINKRRTNPASPRRSRSDGTRGDLPRDDVAMAERGAVTAEEFLSDEDRVTQYLIEKNGEIPQQSIVERTEWSKSKVSRLLSRMEENGQIRKSSNGRENTITFPDELRE